MGHYGMKIAKPGRNIYSTNIDDYTFWSKYPPLTLLEKKAVEISAGSSCNLAFPNVVVPHSYEFPPLVIGVVSKIAGNPTTNNGQKYLMPISGFAGIQCDAGLLQSLFFNYEVYSDRVEILHDAKCVLMGFEACPLTNQTFKVELYFYMWELGSLWPLP